MCCIKIQVNINGSNIAKLPSWVFDADDNVYLDLKEDFTLQQSKTASELDDLDNITIDYTIGGNIPATRKNNAILEAYQFDSYFKGEYKKPLSITIHSPIYNAVQNTLQVLGYDEKAKEYEVDFYNLSENWAYKLKNLKLRNITLPSFTFTKANILTNWNSPKYNDNTLPYYFGLVDYGSEEKTGITRNNFKLSDFRPLYSPLHLLRLAFCEVGYVFRCPALETDVMRRYWIYILNVEFWNYSNKGNLFNASAIARFNPNFQAAYGTDGYRFLNGVRDEFVDLTATTDPNFRIVPKIVNTPFASPNPVLVYENSSSYSQLVKFQTTNEITLNAATTASGIFEFEYIYLRFNIADGSTSKFATSFFIDTSITTSIKNSFSSEIQMKNGDYVITYISLITDISSPVSPIVFNINSATTKITSSEKGISLGDTIQMNQLIEENYTGLQLLKGIVHMLKGKISINEISKTITVYTPSDAVIYNEVAPIEGFLKPIDQSLDYTENQVCKTFRREYKNEFDNRYINIGFKESTDGYIESIKARFGDVPPLGVRIDLGADKELNEETTSDLNPFFEPTAMRDQNASTYGGGVYAPVVWDNTEGATSFNINPRIFYAIGLTPFSFNLDNEYQANAPIMVTKPEFDFFAPNLIPNASYADSKDYKGWVKYFRLSDIAKYSNVIKQFIKVRMSNVDFMNLSFRNLLYLRSETALNFYEAKNTSEFDLCLDTNEIELEVSLFDEPINEC